MARNTKAARSCARAARHVLRTRRKLDRVIRFVEDLQLRLHEDPVTDGGEIPTEEDLREVIHEFTRLDMGIGRLADAVGRVRECLNLEDGESEVDYPGIVDQQGRVMPIAFGDVHTDGPALRHPEPSNEMLEWLQSEMERKATEEPPRTTHEPGQQQAGLGPDPTPEEIEERRAAHAEESGSGDEEPEAGQRPIDMTTLKRRLGKNKPNG